MWLEDVGHLSRHISFKYEHFVGAPQQILDSLLTFLGMRLVRIERSIVDVNPQYFQSWHAWWRLGVRKAVKHFEPEALRFGYSLTACEQIDSLPRAANPIAV
jgi:hypothetical protein